MSQIKVYILTSPFDEESKTGDGDYADALEGIWEPGINSNCEKQIDHSFIGKRFASHALSNSSTNDNSVGDLVSFESLALSNQTSILKQGALYGDMEDVDDTDTKTKSYLDREETAEVLEQVQTIVTSEYLNKKGITCRWLKEEKQDYHYFHQNFDVESIPRKTNPSVACLEVGRNESVVVAGGFHFRTEFLPDQIEPLKQLCLFRTSPYTPQVIVNHENHIHALFLAFGSIRDKHKYQVLELNQAHIADVQMMKETMSAHFTKLEERESFRNECDAIISLMNGTDPIEGKKAQDTLRNLIGHTESYLNVKYLIDAGLSHKEKSYSPQAIPEGVVEESSPLCEKKQCRHYLPNSDLMLEKFKDACLIAENDPDRSKSIEEIIRTILANTGGNEYAVVDVHHRPPVTGALFFPSDVEKFHRAGIAVHVTVHEYKQNDTRRHLQAYTQKLIQAADAVKFFNAKEMKNAEQASITGQLSKEYYYHQQFQNETNSELKQATISKSNIDTTYEKLKVRFSDKCQEDLEQYGSMLASNQFQLESTQPITGKVSLSAAAMKQVAEEPLPSPCEILAKPSNIICFGTIRTGKGFKDAKSLANIIKASTLNNTFPEDQTPPIVYCAGRVEDSVLMISLITTRFNQMLVRAYMANNTIPDDCVRWNEYFKSMIEFLENQEGSINNPYLVIKVDLSPNELMNLKNQCKYVLRIDDMGMRNNGSGIINVLSVGIIYAKWGSVTDKEFQPGYAQGEISTCSNAVDIGEQKYGRFYLKCQTNRRSKKIEGSRQMEAILKSIIAREKNQRECQNIEESVNYKTVVQAQILLQRFLPSRVLTELQVSYEKAVQNYVKLETTPLPPPEAAPPRKGLLALFKKTYQADAAIEISTTLGGPK